MLVAGTEAGKLVVCRRRQGTAGSCAFLDSGLPSRVKRLERVGAGAVAAVGGDGSVAVLSLAALLAQAPRVVRLADSDAVKGERVVASACT